MRYIIYTRKSSESEDRQVQSLGDQIATLREHAKRLGLTVVEELSEAKSAKDPGERPVFAEMLEKVEAGKADGILCWSINRLSRNPVDSGRVSWLLQRGVLRSIRTIDREYLPEDNVLLMAVESGVANQYILDLRKAVVRGMVGKAARGWLPVKPPQGYCFDPVTKEITVRQPQFDLLRRAWELLTSGSYTVPEIHVELAKWGYDSGHHAGSARGLFSVSHLYRIFDNPFYYGVFQFRGQTYQGKHQPMVSKEEFDQCQLRLHGPSQVRPHRHEFAFTGLIRCGSCGCMVTAERKTKRYAGTGRTVVYEYYRCTRRRGKCSEPCVTGAYIESAIAEKLAEFSISSAVGRLVLRVVERDFKDSLGSRASHILSKERSAKAIQEKLDKLLDLRLSNGVTEHEYKRHRERLLKELVDVQAQSDKSALLRQAINNAVRFGVSASRRFKGQGLKEKRQIAVLFGSDYVLTLGRLQFSVHPLLALLSRLEPPKTPSDKVGTGTMMTQIPVEWAWRERIRTLLSDEDIQHWCCVDCSFFDSTELDADVGRAV